MSKEILLVVESVSLEKGVSKEVIFEAIESAMAMATKKRYGEDAEFRVAIDRESGEYDTFRTWKVVNYEDEEEPNPDAMYSVEEAQEIKPGAQLGDVLEEQARIGRAGGSAHFRVDQFADLRLVEWPEMNQVSRRNPRRLANDSTQDCVFARHALDRRRPYGANDCDPVECQIS